MRRILPSPHPPQPTAPTGTARARILPRRNWDSPNLHTLLLQPGGLVKAVKVEWCPICHSRDSITERVNGQRVLWHCNECDHEW